MKKDITPEMYNFNKYPGPKFQQTLERVEAEGICLTLVKDVKGAFDVTAFEQRFSDLMLKFDYIVGDWGNEQLRLRGFYRDEADVPIAQKISRLQDYLIEYCNYGCAYFVLENPEPKPFVLDAEDEQMMVKKRRRRRKKPAGEDKWKARTVPNAIDKPKQAKGQQKKRRHRDKSFAVKTEKKQHDREVRREIQEAKRGFIIRQK